MISLIAVVASNGVIGRAGKLPWHLPADLAYVKRVTMGHTLIMGRKTFQSIGRPLPGRKTVILTRDPNFSAAGCEVVYTIQQALDAADPGEIFVAGGADIYRLFLPLAERMYITHIDADIDGDTFFPAFAKDQWEAVSETPGVVNRANRLPHRFVVYEKRGVGC